MKKAEPSTVFCSHNKRYASNWSCLLLQPKILHEILNKLYSVKTRKLTVHGKRLQKKTVTTKQSSTRSLKLEERERKRDRDVDIYHRERQRDRET